MSLESKKVAVLPAGTWGATWSLVAANQGHEIKLFIRNPQDCETLNKDRTYRKVPDVVFPTNITAVADPQEALDGAEVVVLAPSSLGYREFVRSLVVLNRGQYILNLTKGLEDSTGFRMSEVLQQEHPSASNKLAVWSGPNIANRIALGEAAKAHIASSCSETALFFERSFGRGSIMLHPINDLVGVEFGGALKNIIAIARGIIDGSGLGEVMGKDVTTKGFKEMVELGLAYGADKSTFNGPSGIEDLRVSIEYQSRNYLAGVRLAKGETYSDLISSGITFEGLRTIKPALLLAQKARIKTPVINMVHETVF